MKEWTAQDSGPTRQQTFYQGDGSSIPVAYEAIREAAEAAMSEAACAFVGGGAGDGATLVANRRAFDRWRIVPRVLRGADDRDLAVDCFGRKLRVPVMVAPIGAQSVIHDDAELATARAASDLGVPMAVSTASSVELGRVADALGETPKVFQLYASADERLTASFLDRAEAAGYDAVMVTVDMPYRGWIERELEAGGFPPADGHGLANYLSDPVFCESLETDPEVDMSPAIERYLSIASDPAMTWEGLADLVDMTDLPVLVKGVLHSEDAERAVDLADGVVVSNHGGRSLDGSIGALEALPDVVDTIDSGTVVFDSGIRRGTDAFKALALGADLVMVGRPYAYGLGLAGETGVAEVLKNVIAELDIALANAGKHAVDDLQRSDLRRSS